VEHLHYLVDIRSRFYSMFPSRHPLQSSIDLPNLPVTSGNLLLVQKSDQSYSMEMEEHYQNCWDCFPDSTLHSRDDSITDVNKEDLHSRHVLTISGASVAVDSLGVWGHQHPEGDQQLRHPVRVLAGSVHLQNNHLYICDQIRRCDGSSM